MNYTEEQVRKFLERNNKEWTDLLDKKYIHKETFDRIRNIKLKNVKPSVEILVEDLLENPLQAFITSLTKQRNLWTRINNKTKSEDEREMSLTISNRLDSILKALKNQLNLSKITALTRRRKEK